MDFVQISSLASLPALILPLHYTRGLSIHGFWYPRGSRNQSLKDTREDDTLNGDSIKDLPWGFVELWMRVSKI